MGIASIILKAGAKFIPKVLKKAAGPVVNVVNEIPAQSEINGVTGIARGSAGEYLSGTKGMIKSGLGFLKRELVVNPADRLKSIIPKVGLTIGALQLAKFGATGKLELPTARTTATVTALGVNPVAGAIGLLEGGAKSGGNTLTQTFNNLRNNFFPNNQRSNLNLPDPDFKIKSPSTSTDISQVMPDSVNIHLPDSSFSAPVSTPSYSFNVGGGPSMTDALMPFLLMGGVGVAGYAAYKHFKKKKKYKKKRKHKK